jgi:hypothetical protein
LRDSNQGYWGSPAYLKYTTGGTTNYMLYYSATDQTASVAPLPINGYQLATKGSAGPIPFTYLSTRTLFCDKTPTPSVSSNGTTAGTGIVWAIENQTPRDDTNNNCDKMPPPYLPAALHAFDATNLSAPELYSSRGLTTTIGTPTTFSTPTIFRGQVYVGTTKEVAVFGLCNTNGQSGCMQ